MRPRSHSSLLAHCEMASKKMLKASAAKDISKYVEPLKALHLIGLLECKKLHWLKPNSPFPCTYFALWLDTFNPIGLRKYAIGLVCW